MEIINHRFIIEIIASYDFEKFHRLFLFFLFKMKKNKTYQKEFRQMFEVGKDIKDLALIIDRVNQIKSDDFICFGSSSE